MSTQPEVLRLADALYSNDQQGLLSQAAAELRRLHALNQELLEALHLFANCDMNSDNCASPEVATKRVRSVARAAIAKATGEQA